MLQLVIFFVYNGLGLHCYAFFPCKIYIKFPYDFIIIKFHRRRQIKIYHQV